jgi:hypothetical protein
VLDRNKPNESNYMYVINMMQKISHHKYPAISAAEEEISIPLQVMPLATTLNTELKHATALTKPKCCQPTASPSR